jgi:hypothetical protein
VLADDLAKTTRSRFQSLVAGFQLDIEQPWPLRVSVSEIDTGCAEEELAQCHMEWITVGNPIPETNQPSATVTPMCSPTLEGGPPNHCPLIHRDPQPLQ